MARKVLDVAAIAIVQEMTKQAQQADGHNNNIELSLHLCVYML
jgi:hypothetical protein